MIVYGIFIRFTNIILYLDSSTSAQSLFDIPTGISDMRGVMKDALDIAEKSLDDNTKVSSNCCTVDTNELCTSLRRLVPSFYMQRLAVSFPPVTTIWLAIPRSSPGDGFHDTWTGLNRSIHMVKNLCNVYCTHLYLHDWALMLCLQGLWHS